MATPGGNAECLGSGLYVWGETTTIQPDGTWKGQCPECQGVFSLGYAGLLPVHDVAVGSVDVEPDCW